MIDAQPHRAIHPTAMHEPLTVSVRSGNRAMAAGAGRHCHTLKEAAGATARARTATRCGSSSRRAPQLLHDSITTAGRCRSAQARCLAGATGLLVVCFLSGQLGASELLDWVEAAYQPDATADGVRALAPEQWQRFATLMQSATEQKHLDATLRDGFAALGFTASTRRLDRHRYHLIADQVRAHGNGCYVIDPDSNHPGLIWQAPHARNDRLSEQIAVQAFQQSDAAMLMVSTVSRWTVDAPAGERHGPCDPCHNPRHALQAATLAAYRRWPAGIVVQVHGYSGAKHPALEPYAGVLSHGRATAPDWLDALHCALQPAFALPLARYGIEAKELGGTTNVQGRLLRQSDGWRFIHFEAALASRTALVTEPERLATLVRTCIAALPQQVPATP